MIIYYILLYIIYYILLYIIYYILYIIYYIIIYYILYIIYYIILYIILYYILYYIILYYIMLCYVMLCYVILYYIILLLLLLLLLLYMIHHESMLVANNVIRMHDSTHTCIYIYTHIVVLMVEFTYWGFGLHHSEAHSLIGQRCTQWTGVHPHVQRRRPLHWQKDVFRGLAGVVAPRLGANSFQWCPWKINWMLC